MIIMFCAAILYLVLFFVFDKMKTKYYLNKHQKEWDELKASAIKENPNMDFYDLLDMYIDFCEKKEHYFPSF